MMKILIATISILIASISFACTIKLPPRILVIDPEIREMGQLKAHGCSDEQTQRINSQIIEAEGEIAANYFQEPGITIDSVLKKISIIRLSSLIYEKVPNSLEYRKITTSLPKAFYSLSSEDPSINCFNCLDDLTTLNLMISFRDYMGRKYKFNGSLEKVQFFKVYKARKSFSAFAENLNPKDFELVTIETQIPKNYFTEIKDINFMRATRNIKKGDILLKSHLTAKNIVKYGQVIRILLQSKGVRLTLSGKAMEMGGIGQAIQIKSLKSKKIFSGIITGQGEAKVTL